MRTSGDPECTSPMTSATASSVLAPLPVADARVANPWIRKCPQRVGKSADATCFTFEELTHKLYRLNSHSPGELVRKVRGTRQRQEQDKFELRWQSILERGCKKTPGLQLPAGRSHQA